MIRRFTVFLYYRVFGWKAVGMEHVRPLKKFILIGAPHTSWHDFFIGIAIRQVLDMNISFIGKKELFKWPLGWYFKKVGGIPLDRTSGQNKVEAIANLFSDKEELRIAMSPEGTRARVEHWKTGFYHIAKQAKIPIVMMTFDFGNKLNTFSQPFYPTDDQEKDFEYMYEFFKGIKGKVVAKSFRV